MKVIKKLLLSLSPIALFTVSIPIVASCSNQVSLNEVVDKLLSIKQIKRVEVINDCPSFKYKFILKYEQPVSWTDSTKGTFLQRVEFGFNSYDAINTMWMSGYSINDEKFNKECTNELVTMFNSNFINIEYRYFGDSLPSFYDRQEVSTWDDLTFDNALKDFHCINETLRTFLKGKWVIGGGSKGGQNANLYSMYYPQDATAFVSLVAPKCFSCDKKEDRDKLINHVVNTIGDDSALGKEKAAEMRLEYIEWQHYMLTDEIADVLAPEFHKESIKQDPYPQYVYDHEYALYYDEIINLVLGKWQYNTTPTEVDPDIKAINRITDATQKKTKAIEYFRNEASVGGGGFNSRSYSYYVQGWKQMGFFNANPGILDKKFKELGKSNINWKIPESDFEDFQYKIAFNKDFMEQVKHDEEIGPKLVEWSKTTKSNVIMIYGATDPWYTYALDKTDNPNIHIFVDKIRPHTTYIKTLDEAQRNEATRLLNSWLK